MVSIKCKELIYTDASVKLKKLDYTSIYSDTHILIGILVD